MFTAENISTIANVCTIISSLSIVCALYFYIREKIEKHSVLNFSLAKKRNKYFKAIANNPLAIEKIITQTVKIKKNNLGLVLAEKYNNSIKESREQNLKNGLKFIFSNDAIQAIAILTPEKINNMELILSRFCSLTLDQADFYENDSKRVDAWVNLENEKKFIIKFPIPKNLYDEKIFNDIRFGSDSISNLGNDIIDSYFYPYLIRYVSQQYETITKNDIVTLLSPHSWEIGPS